MHTQSAPNALADLRTAIAGVTSLARKEAAQPFDLADLDKGLAHGGLDKSALHEAAPVSATLADEAAATLFLAGIAARLSVNGAGSLWVVARFDLYAPGLEQVGLEPNQITYVEAGDDQNVLACMEDALRGGAFAVVVGEVRRADMTATRRLQLAAAERGTPALLMRRWRRAGSCPLQVPSAASTRWRIGCAPSAPLGHAGVGRSRWTVELARQRNGPPFSLTVEGCDAQGRLAPVAAPRHRAIAMAGAAARAA